VFDIVYIISSNNWYYHIQWKKSL